MKLVVSEAGTPAMKRFADRTEDVSKIITVFTMVEIRSVLRRRELTGDLSSTEAASAYRTIEAILQGFIQQPITSEVVTTASGLVARHSLRTLDALQLGSALVYQRALHPSEELILIASDRKLLAAASAEGFTVWNPAESV